MENFLNDYAKLAGKDHVNQLVAEGKLAAQIKTERTKRGLSQQDLANRIHTPKSTIGRIEAGLTSPTVNTLLKISRALDIVLFIDGREKSAVND